MTYLLFVHLVCMWVVEEMRFQPAQPIPLTPAVAPTTLTPVVVPMSMQVITQVPVDAGHNVGDNAGGNAGDSADDDADAGGCADIGGRITAGSLLPVNKDFIYYKCIITYNVIISCEKIVKYLRLLTLVLAISFSEYLWQTNERHGFRGAWSRHSYIKSRRDTRLYVKHRAYAHCARRLVF